MGAVRPLDGITVLSLEHAVAAPFCTRQLADLGARVIKVERPGQGDFARGYDERVRGMSSYFCWLNRSKESLSLDLKHPESAAILDALVVKADVVVQNLAPGAAARLGLSEARLRARFPRLILCEISGYGADGPYRDRKAYDLLVQAEAALMSVTGSPGQAMRAGISVADVAAGMYAYTNILAALLRRDRTGEGSRIDVSMLECLAEWMGNPLYYAFEGAPQAPRAGGRHPSIAPYGPMRCGDGRSVVFSVQNDREWQAFCATVLQRPALAADERFSTNTRRTANKDALYALIEDLFGALTLEEAVARLDAAGIGNAMQREVADLWAHPALAARGRWGQVDSPVGPLPALKPPGAQTGFEPRMDAIPSVGQHTAAILAELGVAPATVDRLHTDGAI